MKENISRRVPEEKAATPDEIRRAIEALTAEDFKRLQDFAQNRIRKLGTIARDLTHGGLQNEAITSLLDSTRRWNREKVNLTGFLIGAMRSITSNLARGYDPREQAVLQSDVVRQTTSGGELPTVFDTTPAPGLNPEQALLTDARAATAKQLILQIEEMLAGDAEALNVLDGWRAEMTVPEIKEALGFSDTQFNTIVRRIRRKAKGIAGERHGR